MSDVLRNENGITVEQFLDWLEQLPGGSEEATLTYDTHAACVRECHFDGSSISFDKMTGSNQ